MHGLIYDYDQRACRKPTHQDMRNFITLANHFKLPGKVAVVSFDVPQSVVSIHAWAMSHLYSTRPVGIEPDTLNDAAWCVKVIEAATGKKLNVPYLDNYVSAKSPLVIGGRATEILLRQSRDGFLTTVSGMPMTGASTPITLASSMVMHLAEHVGFNTISRLLCRPPNNVFSKRAIGFSPCMMDVRKGNFFIASSEKMLMTGAWTQLLGEFYKMQVVPSIATYVDAQEPGPQAAEEKMLLVMGAMMCCPGYHNEKPAATAILGALNSNLTLSYEQCLLDLNVVSQVNRLLRGIRVDRESLAVDVIREVGPGGTFLDTEHTLAHYSEEFTYPKYSFRGPWEAWAQSGRKNPVDAAHAEVSAILAKKVEPVLSEERRKALHRVVQDAEKDILGQTTGVLP
jgi:trimethylamine---corrinoid protein Co-methyltransferase